LLNNDADARHEGEQTRDKEVHEFCLSDWQSCLTL